MAPIIRNTKMSANFINGDLITFELKDDSTENINRLTDLLNKYTDIKEEESDVIYYVIKNDDVNRQCVLTGKAELPENGYLLGIYWPNISKKDSDQLEKIKSNFAAAHFDDFIKYRKSRNTSY